MSNRGYLVPDNVQPDGFRCFCVYIPDDDMYQRAFFGAYEFFGAWLAWERDDAKRGRLAADAWKKAIELTRDTMSCESYDYTGVFGDIADAIRAISISQVVNCGASPGLCIDEDGNTTYTPPPEPEHIPDTDGGTWPYNPDVDEPPDAYNNWTEFDARACYVANSMWQVLYWQVLAINGVVGTFTTLAVGIVVLAAALPAAFVSAVGLATVAGLAQGYLELAVLEDITDLIPEIQDWLVEQKEEIVCTIYTHRHNIPGMKIEILAVMMAYLRSTLSLTEQESAALSNFMIKAFPVNLLFNWLYEAGEAIEAEELIDCSTCAAGYVMTFSDGINPGWTDDQIELTFENGYMVLNPVDRLEEKETYLTGLEMETLFSLPSPSTMTLTAVRMRYQWYDADGDMTGATFKARAEQSDSTADHFLDTTPDADGTNVWIDATFPVNNIVLETPGTCLILMVHKNNQVWPSTGTKQLLIDRIEFIMDVS